MPWKELLKVALLGTENSTFSEDTLQTLQQQGVDVEKETPMVLAEGAALYAQLIKAGFRLADFEGALPKAATEINEKNCSHRSAHHLFLILSGQYEPVLPEFIQHLLNNGKCLPTEHLPALLRRIKNEEDWLSVESAIGASGHWLLAQHPDWRKWLSDASNFDWQTGSKDERHALLRHLRKHDPVRAIEHLENTWNDEDYKDKSAFLKELETGLSLLDEPLLEYALNDGRKEVRQAAAVLLARLPASRLSQRMWQRALECLVYTNKTLKINIPDEPDEAALRDGILKIATNWKGGAKAGYLGQIVSMVPPGRWEGFFKKMPLDILDLFFRTDWAATLMPACAGAAVFHADEVWMDAVLAWAFEYESSLLWEAEDIPLLIKSAPPETVNRLVVKSLERSNALPELASPAFKLLLHSDCALDDLIALALISRLQKWLGEASRSDFRSYQYPVFLKMVALRCRPSLYEELQKGWNQAVPLWAFWEKQVEKMLNTVLFRKEMIAELNG